MPGTAALLAAAALAAIVYVPGWTLARALCLRADTFARVWCGLAAVSIAGLLLARAGLFSLATLLVVLAVASGIALLVASVRERRARDTRRGPMALADPTRVDGARDAPAASGAVATPAVRHPRCSILALGAGLAVILWCWPPFETILGGSDSTMYLNAGIHLARSGTLVVPETVVSLLPAPLAANIFPSVSADGRGPFIRLPGGLLMASASGGSATPAFFPLLPVWVGVQVALAGATAAPAVAPLFAGLAVWSVALFAGEVFGLLTGALTALLFASNFALWWYGRFAMPETLTALFLWGGLVLIGRGAASATEAPRSEATAEDTARAAGTAFMAGVLFGLAGLARTETFAFLAIAGALWLAWTRARVAIAPLIGGFALIAALGALTLATAPSHHLAYLRNDFWMFVLGLVQRHPRVWSVRWLPAGALSLALIGAAGAWLGRRPGVGFGRGIARAGALTAALAAFVAYVQLVPHARPLRSVEWLAAYSSWPQLALALAGAVLGWRRGGAAGRLALLLVAAVAAVYLVNPRVARFQPWAIRRYLPVIIPGTTAAAAVALATLAHSPRASRRVLALLATAAVAALVLRPIVPARTQPFYAGGFAATAALAERLAPGALVVIDSSFADLQIQVPLWLWHGRETLVMEGGSERWGQVVRALLASGRPVYWVGNRYERPPSASGLVFSALEPDPLFTVAFPEAPEGTPPRNAVYLVAPLRAYEVGEGGTTAGVKN